MTATDPAARHPLTAAVLAVLPTKSDGQAALRYVPARDLHWGMIVDAAVMGDPHRLAAQIAAAVIRALDEQLATGWVYDSLSALAHEIDRSVAP
jgi:hypothetical protein